MLNIIERSNENLIVVDVTSRLLQDRIVMIDDVIDSNLANTVMKTLLYLDSISNETINIYINSVGGQVNQGLALYDLSKTLKSPIRTICFAEAYSMAAVLMFMGKERIAMKNSRFMLHQIRGGTIGTFKEMQISVEEANCLQSVIYDIIRENTNIKDPEKELLFDKWMNSKEALSCGLITEIK